MLNKRNILLLIDDNYATRVLISEILYEKNIVIIGSGEQKQALQHFNNHIEEIFLVIVGLNLRDCSSIELINYFKKLNSKIPVVAMSASSKIEMAEKTERLNLNGFISIPFDIDEFCEFVNSYL